MTIGIRSHYAAGTGALAIETREEKRVLRDIINELPEGTPIASVAAPSGIVKDVRTNRQIDTTQGLVAGYAWASAGPGRVLVVYDWHTLANAPGTWRALLEALPCLRSPRGAGESDPASLVIFIGPTFELTPVNPLRGALPILGYSPPDRQAIERTASALAPLPADKKEEIIDALCGLSADAAEQAAAEVIARGKGWDCDALRDARRQELKTAGLEVWTSCNRTGRFDRLTRLLRDAGFPVAARPAAFRASPAVCRLAGHRQKLLCPLAGPPPRLRVCSIVDPGSEGGHRGCF